mmetsp:Transcript_12121/g.27026  ORF Transcript_12121/g.27026 Transcript_12121/m.27026 type:complete len:225 (+) Transcript_12121:2072-2746(+)
MHCGVGGDSPLAVGGRGVQEAAAAGAGDDCCGGGGERRGGGLDGGDAVDHTAAASVPGAAAVQVDPPAALCLRNLLRAEARLRTAARPAKPAPRDRLRVRGAPGHAAGSVRGPAHLPRQLPHDALPLHGGTHEPHGGRGTAPGPAHGIQRGTRVPERRQQEVPRRGSRDLALLRGARARRGAAALPGTGPGRVQQQDHALLGGHRPVPAGARAPRRGPSFGGWG